MVMIYSENDLGEKIDVRQALLAFQKLVDLGSKEGEVYQLGKLKGHTDYDGYTVFLSDDHVSLEVHFHNRYKIDFPDRPALDAFIRSINEITQL